MREARRIRFNAGWRVAAAAAALLAGCTPEPAPVAVSTTRVYAIDLTGGAKSCKVLPEKPLLAPGKTTLVAMTVGNSGGWCAVTVAQAGPNPYDAGLLEARPAHGTAYIHTVGDNTRIDYTPSSGYAGPDAFTVSLIPGNPTLRVAVTVTR